MTKDTNYNLAELRKYVDKTLVDYNQQKFIMDTQEIIKNEEHDAYLKVAAALFGLFFIIFPLLPLTATMFFINNFFDLVPRAIVAIPAELVTAALVGGPVNNMIIKKKIPLFMAHRSIINRINQIEELQNKNPILKEKSPQELKYLYLEAVKYHENAKAKARGKRPTVAKMYAFNAGISARLSIAKNNAYNFLEAKHYPEERADFLLYGLSQPINSKLAVYIDKKVDNFIRRRERKKRNKH